MLYSHDLYLPLQKIGCTRQYASELALRSLALSLQKIGCTRQYASELALRSLALSLRQDYDRCAR